MNRYWITPPELYQTLDDEFGFDFDPCPFPREDNYNSLELPWGKMNYCNPPFRKTGGNAHKHKWTDEERDIVRREYNGTNQKSQQIADKLSYLTGDKVTLFAVKGQAAKMGIMQDKSPDWTEKELEQISELVHQYSIPQVAKRLHRSPNAVKIKATRLKLGLRARDGWFTKKEVCEMCGVDHKKVQQWIDNGQLIASYHNGVRPSLKGMRMWHIDEQDLRDFILNNSGRLLGRNVDIQQIVWLLT